MYPGVLMLSVMVEARHLFGCGGKVKLIYNDSVRNSSS